MGAGSAISGMVADGTDVAIGLMGDLLPLVATFAGLALVGLVIVLIRSVIGRG